MRVLAVSDLHVDYEENRRWVSEVSSSDYRDDVLILAGDISDSMPLLEECFTTLAQRFAHLLYVPGNHELWVQRSKKTDNIQDSIEKFKQVCRLAEDCGASTQPLELDGLSLVPLFGWYDFSFGEPSDKLKQMWTDFRACKWPDGFELPDINEYFIELNEPHLNIRNNTVISFSHFLPRIDLMPMYIPMQYRYIYPALGSNLIEEQIRRLGSDIHVYGHSHLNRRVDIDGIRYINSAFGYPSEDRISAKQFQCIWQD